MLGTRGASRSLSRPRPVSVWQFSATLMEIGWVPTTQKAALSKLQMTNLFLAKCACVCRVELRRPASLKQKRKSWLPATQGPAVRFPHPRRLEPSHG